jgi:transposase
VPLSFAPGEAYQLDWSHEIVVLDGVTTIVKVAHVRLCHSRMMFVRAYPRETQEMAFDAPERAFAFFKGVCGRSGQKSKPALSCKHPESRWPTTPPIAGANQSMLVVDFQFLDAKR